MKTAKKFIIAMSLTFFIAKSHAQSKLSAHLLHGSDMANSVKMKAMADNETELAFVRNSAGVFLKWQTQQEMNTSHFEVEISFDNEHFSLAKKVAASDITDWNTSYQAIFSRSYLSASKIYYRLKTVFNDGTFTCSDASAFEIKTNLSKPSYAMIN